MICVNSEALARFEFEQAQCEEVYAAAYEQAESELGPKFGKFDELVLQLKQLEESFSKLAAYSGPSDHLHEFCSDIGGGLADLLHHLGQELPKGQTLQAQLDSLWDSECDRYAETMLENGDY